MSGDSYPKFRAAAVQAEPVPLDREACIDKACSLIEEAGRNGAKIIAFPEGFIPGHPNWLYFYPPGDAMKQFYREFFKNSVEVPSPATERLGRAARKDMKSGPIGKLFAAAVVASVAFTPATAIAQADKTGAKSLHTLSVGLSDDPRLRPALPRDRKGLSG